MRATRGFMVSAISGLVLLTSCAPSYQSGVGVTARYGPGIEFYDYSPRAFGDWRTSYRQWQPVVVYEYQGSYYGRNIRGARPVQIYRSPTGYFLPPRDQDWARTDRRFNDKKRPTDADYRRARQRP
jgi:hypothetical protein